MLSIYAQQLAKDVLPDLMDHPLIEFFQVTLQPAFNTPLTAFVSIFHMLGFSAQPEGLYCEKADALLEWPPSSMDSFLHSLRD
eukprot:2552087-Amphidinium_carterae.1